MGSTCLGLRQMLASDKFLQRTLDLAFRLLEVLAMKATYRITRSFTIICIITASAFSAQAQVDSDDAQPLAVSRGCLWNADNSTWKELGLKHSQIARLEELREQYPAVVDGQWVVDDTALLPVPAGAEPMHAGPNVSTSLSGPAPGMRVTETKVEVPTVENTARPKGLQDHLRQVLTPVQLRQWAAACGF